MAASGDQARLLARAEGSSVRLDDMPGVASHASIRVRCNILAGRRVARAMFRMYPREALVGEVHVGVITDGSTRIVGA
jgi:hypothetical protein